MAKLLIICNNNWRIIFNSFSLIKAIKNKTPQATIHYLAHSNIQNLLAQKNEIEKIIIQQPDFVPIVFELLKEKYTHIIDLCGDSNSFFIKKYLSHQFNANTKIYNYSTTLLGQVLLKHKLIYSNTLSTLLCKKCSDIAAPFDGKKYSFQIPTEKQLGKDDLPLSHLAGFDAILLKSDIKAVEKETIKQKIIATTSPIILLGENNTANLADELAQFNSNKVYNSVGKFTIFEQFDIFCRSTKNYIIDTNLAYLAIASGKPFTNYGQINLATSDFE